MYMAGLNTFSKVVAIFLCVWALVAFMAYDSSSVPPIIFFGAFFLVILGLFNCITLSKRYQSAKWAAVPYIPGLIFVIGFAIAYASRPAGSVVAYIALAVMIGITFYSSYVRFIKQ